MAIYSLFKLAITQIYREIENGERQECMRTYEFKTYRGLKGFIDLYGLREPKIVLTKRKTFLLTVPFDLGIVFGYRHKIKTYFNKRKNND
jgi:hypothetical protein